MLPDRMEIRLRDYGKFRDIEIGEDGSDEDREPGGCGLRIIKGVMDEVRFRPAEEEGTLLTMVKFRSPGER
jgi:anti-sigma regulatory factor (Ser/Thr protein kinase)